jgi:hypothetical protein
MLRASDDGEVMRNMLAAKRSSTPLLNSQAR